MVSGEQRGLTMTATEIFLEYCQQKAWANEDGLVLIPYKRFLDEFDALQAIRHLRRAEPARNVGTLKE